jgi:DNA-binding phage protein
MAGKREYDLASIRKAIEEHGTITAIAYALGCQRATVYSYLRKYPELQAAFDKKNGGEKSIVAASDDSRTAHTIEAVLAAINKSRGIKASVASALGCSRQTVDNYLKRWPQLKESLEAERAALIQIASNALVADVNNAESRGHQAAYMFVLKTIGKDEGFIERSEVSGPDGKSLFELPPDVIQLAHVIGFDWAAVGTQLAQMIRLAAEQKGLLGNGQAS